MLTWIAIVVAFAIWSERAWKLKHAYPVVSLFVARFPFFSPKYHLFDADDRAVIREYRRRIKLLWSFIAVSAVITILLFVLTGGKF